MVKVGVVGRVYIDCVFFGFCSYDRTVVSVVSVVAVVFCLPDFKKFHGLFSVVQGVRSIMEGISRHIPACGIESFTIHDAVLYTMTIIKIFIVYS